MIVDSTSANRSAMADLAAANNVADVVNIYFVRATATGSNWSLSTATGARSLWVQDTRGGQTVNTRANFRRVVVSLAHEIGHFFTLPHMCDNASGDPCTNAEQARLMMGDGTDETSIQLSIAEAQTAYAAADGLAD